MFNKTIHNHYKNCCGAEKSGGNDVTGWGLFALLVLIGLAFLVRQVGGRGAAAKVSTPIPMAQPQGGGFWEGVGDFFGGVGMILALGAGLAGGFCILLAVVLSVGNWVINRREKRAKAELIARDRVQLSGAPGRISAPRNTPALNAPALNAPRAELIAPAAVAVGARRVEVERIPYTEFETV